jgi:hypothetical protein
MVVVVLELRFPRKRGWVVDIFGPIVVFPKTKLHEFIVIAVLET